MDYNKMKPGVINKKCYAPFCNNVFYSPLTKMEFKNIHFFRFPSILDRRKKWFEVLNLEFTNKSVYLCAEHFRNSDFCDSTNKRLSKFAMPSIIHEENMVTKPLVCQSTLGSNETPAADDKKISETLDKEDLHEDIGVLLKIDRNKSRKKGPEVHDEITNNLTVLLQHGLEKKVREKILEKYEINKNCPALFAPILNEEIESSLPEINIKQDKFIQTLQNQIGHGLAAIATPLSQLLKAGDRKNAMLPCLTDVSKIFSDLHHSLSLYRRHLITPQLNSTSRKILEKTNISNTLFGDNVSDKIKNSLATKRLNNTMTTRVSKKPYSDATPSTLNSLTVPFEEESLQNGEKS